MISRPRSARKIILRLKSEHAQMHKNRTNMSRFRPDKPVRFFLFKNCSKNFQKPIDKYIIQLYYIYITQLYYFKKEAL